MNEFNDNKEKFALMCNGKSFGAKYLIDTNGSLWDAVTGDEIAWQREAAADLSKGSKVRMENAGRRKFSKLLADDGTIVTVGRAEAVAWSVPDIAAGRKTGSVVVFKDGDMSNEIAGNLSWGSPHERIEKTRANKSGKTGGSSSQILSDEDVREILASYNPYDPGNNSRAFADKFGVAQTTINNVVSNKTFPHVDRKPFAANQHIKQERYFNSYVPGEGTILYERYVKMGRIKPAETETAENSNDGNDANADNPA